MLLGTRDEISQLLRLGKGVAVQGQHHIARLNAGLCRSAHRLLHQQPADNINLSAFVGREGSHRQSECVMAKLRQVCGFFR